MQLEVLLLNTLKGCIPIAPVHMTSLGNASFMQMNFTLATNWPAMQGRHGQFISAEFGKDLSKSDLWFTLFVHRSEQVGQLQANIGQCFRLILEHMFGNKFAHPHAGVLLQHGPARLKLYWTLGFFSKMAVLRNSLFQTSRTVGPECVWLAKIFSE